MSTISIVVPVLNEEDTVSIFYHTVNKINKLRLPSIIFEYWFIDDGSTDKTLTEVLALKEINNNVHYIHFSRNFGKEAALYAGLEHATGNYVVVMDVDLQDSPELLPDLYKEISTDEWDIVGTRRKNRKGESMIRSWFSTASYKVINHISSTKIVDGARDYRIMTRQVVESILSMTEYNRFSKGIFSWVGFNQKYISFENNERIAGNTSWSFLSLIKYSIEGIVAFSQTPLVIVSVLGFITFILALIGAIIVIIRAIVMPDVSAFGWPSMVVIMLGLGGIQLLSLGIVGRYVSSIYLEVKNRPIYIAKKID